MKGRRRPDTRRDRLPRNLRAGDYWRVLDVGTGEPAVSDSPSNLTGGVWMVAVPCADEPTEDGRGFGLGTLVHHTVREEEDGTISVRAGDGSSNSILVSNARRSWHGYIEYGEFRAVP